MKTLTKIGYHTPWLMPSGKINWWSVIGDSLSAVLIVLTFTILWVLW